MLVGVKQSGYLRYLRASGTVEDEAAYKLTDKVWDVLGESCTQGG